MVALSILFVGGFLGLGLSFTTVGLMYLGPFQMLGALSTFALLEQGMTGTNLVALFFWLIRLFV